MALALPARALTPADLPRVAVLMLMASGLAALASVPTLEVTIAVAAALFVVVLTLIRPEAGVIALVAVVPFSSPLKVTLGEVDIAPTEPMVALFALAWLLRSGSERHFVVPQGRVLAPLGALLALVLASMLVAEKLGLAAKEAIKWAEIFLLYVFVAVHFRDRRWILALLGALFLVASIEALYGIYQFVTGTGPAFFAVGVFMRAHGHFGQPNPYAGYLASVIPLAMAMAIAAPGRSFRLCSAAALALLATATVMSLSRGAWLGLSLALVAMYVVWRPGAGRRLAPLALSAIVVAILGLLNLLPAVVTERLGPTVEQFGVYDVSDVRPTPENFAVVERLAHWQAGWRMLVEHPWLGVGAGNYPARYDEYALRGWPESLGHAHNYYLNMAAEAGLAAFGALAWLLVAAFATVRQGLKGEADFRRALVAGLLGSTIVFTVHSLFDNLLVHSMAVQVGVILGLAEAARHPLMETTRG